MTEIKHITNINANIKPIDYLVIGHITKDITIKGNMIGGTSTFAGLTAKSLGLNVGIISSFSNDLDLSSLNDIQIINIQSPKSTSFINHQNEGKRSQRVLSEAEEILFEYIPEVWKKTPIIHLGPVINEINPEIIYKFLGDNLFLTPQGWLREVGKRGEVNLIPWKINMDLLRKTSAIVLSSEDLNNDEKQISQLASRCPILVITENKNGARLYWNGDVRHFSAPKTEFVDDTGAGDIFSAAFFTKLKKTNDPWESVKFAVKLASFSVAKFHLESIPNQDEIKAAEIEIIG